MKIHLFTLHYPIPYKPYYDSQFAEFVDSGHDVTIFAASPLDRELNEKVVRYGLAERTRYYPLTQRNIPRFSGALIGSASRTAGRVIRVLPALQASPGGTSANVARALLVAGDEPDVCIVHGLGTAVHFAWLRDIFPGVPLAMYYHGGEVPSVPPLSDDVSRRAFEGVDIVFTNTEFSRAHAIERGCDPAKVVVLPVGFALDDFTPPSERRYRVGGVLRLLSAGRMSEEKGFIYALEAVRTLVNSGIRDIHYSLTGEGYLRPALEDYVRENALEQYVTFLGTLSTEGVVKAMGEHDVLLLPSVQVGNWVENQACAVQEAMLMKSLVVTTRTGGVPESIPPEMREFSVEARDAAGLAAAIERIRTLSDRRVVQLGQTCRDFVVQGYDIRRLNKRMLRELLKQSDTARARPPDRAACA